MSAIKSPGLAVSKTEFWELCITAVLPKAVKHPHINRYTREGCHCSIFTTFNNLIQAITSGFHSACHKLDDRDLPAIHEHYMPTQSRPATHTALSGHLHQQNNGQWPTESKRNEKNKNHQSQLRTWMSTRKQRYQDCQNGSRVIACEYFQNNQRQRIV